MGKDKTTMCQEEPWVTELLRDILQDDSHIPVWRYAEGYRPSSANMDCVIHQLPPREIHLVYALYRDELPLQKAYEIDALSSHEAATLLNHALTELRKPCNLRIVMKGMSECETESATICRLPPEDIVELGIETLSIPCFVWDAYVSVGIRTVGQLHGYLRDSEMIHDAGVPITASLQAVAQDRLTSLGIWDALLPVRTRADGCWVEELVPMFRSAPAMVEKSIVRAALAELAVYEREILSGIYQMSHSEQLVALHLRMSCSEVAAIHARALDSLRRSAVRIAEDRPVSIMDWRTPDESTPSRKK